MQITSHPPLDYMALAKCTEEVRFFVAPGKKVEQSYADFAHEYEVIHAAFTAQTADQIQACRQYYQVLHYGEASVPYILKEWNSLVAPFPQITPQPFTYQPAATTRHRWTSLDALREAFDDPSYKDETAQHIFCRLDQYGAFLTPITRLSWDINIASFVNANAPDPNAKIHVFLFLGDSQSGATHDEIYSILELRRIYVESILKSRTDLSNSLLRFLQNGKMKEIRCGNEGKQDMIQLLEKTPFIHGIFHHHVAVEEYFFKSSHDALVFFMAMPKLRDYLWDGSQGSFTFVGEQRIIFDKDGEI